MPAAARRPAAGPPCLAFAQVGSSRAACLAPCRQTRTWSPGQTLCPAREVGGTPGFRYLWNVVDGVPVVTTPAEIDLTTADQLRAVLLAAASGGHVTVVVDMTGTRVLRLTGAQYAYPGSSAGLGRGRRAAAGRCR
jgi:hypothetical protein